MSACTPIAHTRHSMPSIETMVRGRRLSALHVLISIFFLACATLALTWLLPGAPGAVWLSNNWKSLGLVLVGLYMTYRFRGYLRPPREPANVRSAPLPPSSFRAGGVPALSELVWGSPEWSRAETLNEAENLPIADAVYRVVAFNNVWPHVRIDPSELPRLTSAEQFEEWSRCVGKLRNQAGHVADAFRRRDGTYEAARARLVTENPGFSYETYERVIGYGFQITR
jgi:hypothetical protein